MTNHAKSLLLVVALVFSSCNDNAIQQASKALRDSAKAIGVFQDTIIDANVRGVVSTNDTRAILETTETINAAGQRAVTLLRVMDATGNKDPKEVLLILDAVTTELASFALTLQISDSNLKASLIASIQLAQASLNTAKLILAGSAQ